MIYSILADGVLLVHALFIVFVIFGGFLVLWKHDLAWLHLPAMAWGAAIVAGGWICPLTPLENILRRMAGLAHYSGGFIEHYLVLAIYPPGLTRGMQVLLAVLLVLGNVLVYAISYCRRH